MTQQQPIVHLGEPDGPASPRIDYWRDRAQAAERQAAELQQTFDLQWAADQRAIKRWQAAGPGRELTWPDRANMVVWLLEQLEGKAP